MIISITHNSRTTEHHMVFDDPPSPGYIRSLAEELRGVPYGAFAGLDVTFVRGVEGADDQYLVRPPASAPEVSDAMLAKLKLEVAVEALEAYAGSPGVETRAVEALRAIRAMERS